MRGRKWRRITKMSEYTREGREIIPKGKVKGETDETA